MQTLQQEETLLALPSLSIAQQVQAQDVQVDEKGKESLIKGVAKDRRISVEDSEMRHGCKSRSVLLDGYKRHVLHNPDTGLIRVVGITPAISEDLERQEVCLLASSREQTLSQASIYVGLGTADDPLSG